MAEGRERFRRIYDDNYDRILGYALRRTDTVEDAHDVVSETFLVAWRRLDDVPHGERARLWLYGAARKVVANHHRSERRRRRLTARLETGLSRPDRVDAFADDTDVERIAAAFSRLTDTDREILTLIGWEGLDAGQLAEVLGGTRANARLRLHRARRRFAKAIELEADAAKRRAWSGHESRGWATARPGQEETL